MGLGTRMEAPLGTVVGGRGSQDGQCGSLGHPCGSSSAEGARLGLARSQVLVALDQEQGLPRCTQAKVSPRKLGGAVVVPTQPSRPSLQLRTRVPQGPEGEAGGSRPHSSLEAGSIHPNPIPSASRPLSHQRAGVFRGTAPMEGPLRRGKQANPGPGDGAQALEK